MKNREKLLKTNEYDLLMAIHTNLRKQGLTGCVLSLMEPHFRPHDCTIKRLCEGCDKCIQEWLNELVK